MNRHQMQRLEALITAMEAEREQLSWNEEQLLGELKEIRQAQGKDALQSYLNETYGEAPKPQSSPSFDAPRAGQDAFGYYHKQTYGS